MDDVQRSTLDLIYMEPVPLNIEWSRVESLLEALGAIIIDGTTARLIFELNGIIGAFGRSTNQQDVKRYQVKDIRSLFDSAGVKP